MRFSKGVAVVLGAAAVAPLFYNPLLDVPFLLAVQASPARILSFPGNLALSWLTGSPSLLLVAYRLFGASALDVWWPRSFLPWFVMDQPVTGRERTMNSIFCEGGGRSLLASLRGIKQKFAVRIFV